MWSRRQANLLLLSASTLAMAPFLKASAQSAEVKTATAEARDGESTLRTLITQETPDLLPPDRAKELSGREYGVISNFLSKVSSFDNIQLEDYVETPGIRDHLDLFQKEKIPLAPNPETVQPLKAEPLPEAQTLPEDTLQSLLIDVFLDTMGLADVAEILKEVIKTSPELTGTLDNIVQALGVRDWEQVYDLAVQFFELLMRKTVLDAATKVIGTERVNWLLVRLLPKFAGRLVPFVGWGLIAFSFIFSIKKNWPRIEKRL